MITRKSIFISLLFLSTVAFADANDGEYLGFKLGSTYSAPAGAIGREHTMGALVYIVNPHQRHQHLGSLSIYVSPKSSIIGSVFGDWYFSSKQTAQQFLDRHMQTLQTTYSGWKRGRNTLTKADYQMWVELEQKPPIVDHWPSDKKFRVSVALVYAPESSVRNSWMTLVKRESNTQ